MGCPREEASLKDWEEVKAAHLESAGDLRERNALKGSSFIERGESLRIRKCRPPRREKLPQRLRVPSSKDFSGMDKGLRVQTC